MSDVLVLKDGSKATIFYIENKEQAKHVPDEIVAQIRDIFDYVVEEGQTYPYVEKYETVEKTRELWMPYATAILVDGVQEKLSAGQKVLGTYYVKPNYVGRCSHNCNAGFLVSPEIRGKGIGKVMGKSYLQWAPKLGYTYSVFNLVFETNIGSIKIWDSLGFDRIGRVPGAAHLKGIDHPVSAIMFGKSLV